jgi:hypothetical protein
VDNAASYASAIISMSSQFPFGSSYFLFGCTGPDTHPFGVCCCISLSPVFLHGFCLQRNCPLTAFLLMLDAIMEEKDVFSHWFQ